MKSVKKEMKYGVVFDANRESCGKRSLKRWWGDKNVFRDSSIGDYNAIKQTSIKDLMQKQRDKGVSIGVIYTAIDNFYLKQAAESAESLKQYADISVTVFTDDIRKATELGRFDHVIRCEPDKRARERSLYMLDRLKNLLLTPYEYTLALDTDTYILTDIERIFNILYSFDLAMTYNFNPDKRYKLAIDAGAINEDIDMEFPMVQGGFQLYRKSNNTWKYIYDLINTYIEKKYFDDQISMRECIWKNDIKACLLPREFNFNNLQLLLTWGEKNGDNWDWPEIKPRIFHYAGFEKKDIRYVRKTLRMFNL
jgi:hypothetical protein